MTSPHELAAARRAGEQARITEVLATSAVFSGTLSGLSRAFRLAPDDLRACLRDLVGTGRLVVTTQPDDRLTIRLERRSSEERRRPVPGTWPL